MDVLYGISHHDRELNFPIFIGFLLKLNNFDKNNSNLQPNNGSFCELWYSEAGSRKLNPAILLWDILPEKKYFNN